MKAVKTTPKATKQAHPYRIDGNGLPHPVGLKDVPPQSYDWGGVSGLALVVDLFNWRKVLSADEAANEVADFVRSFMEEASAELTAPHVEAQGNCRRAIAIGMLDGFASLVTHALESNAAREYMAAQLIEKVQFHETLAAEEMEKEKTMALNIHGIAGPKGGPRNE